MDSPRSPHKRRDVLKTLAFTTAGLPLSSRAISEIQKLPRTINLGLISDPHIGFVDGAETRLTAFLEAMNKQKPNALIQLGDFAYPNSKCSPSIDAFNKAHEHVFHTIGNHDIKDHGLTREDCKKLWGIPAPYYDQVLDGLHLIVLDGNEEGSPTHNGGYPSYIGKKQQSWLTERLQKSSHPVLIISHQPLAGEAAVDNAREMQTLLNKFSDKIILCINGHSHLDQHLTIEGISYLHINSASYFWLGGKVRLAEYKDPLFATLSIDPNKGEITINGVISTWKNGTPEDVSYFQNKKAGLKEIVTPRISDRTIKF